MWVKVRLRWLSPAQGGRASPPLGPRYAAVGRFLALDGPLPREEWSVVLEIESPADGDTRMAADLRLLVPDAPTRVLRDGAAFFLLEGPHVVAEGEIIGPSGRSGF